MRVVKMEVEEGPREEDEAVKGILEEDEIKEEEEDEQRMEVVVKNENGSPAEATTASPTGQLLFFYMGGYLRCNTPRNQ